MRPAALLAALVLAGCPSAPPAPAPPPAASASAPAPPPTVVASASNPPDASAAPDASAGDPPRLDPATVLFPDVATTPPGANGCLPIADAQDRVRCLFAMRYEGDREAEKMALDLFEGTGSVAGVDVEQDMDGGFRGKIHLVPEVPMGKHRRHLAWGAAALRDFDTFFEKLAGAARAPIRYRVRSVALRFFRSVGRTTPSAYAQGWGVAYNVSGSLNTSADAVRETFFHELFHVNDGARGDWSKQNLSAIFDSIVARCGTRVACLRPYAPGDTMVRGGTYYAFQPDNGESVHEYAAELAGRYYREQRAIQRGEALGRPAFKCGPEENRRAWAAMVDEFFGGADSVPPCPAP